MVGDYDDLGDFLGLVLIDVEVSGPKGGGTFATEASIRIDGARCRYAGRTEYKRLSVWFARRYHAHLRTLLPQCLCAMGGNHSQKEEQTVRAGSRDLFEHPSR